MSNKSASTDQSLNTSNQNQTYYPYNNNNNIYYYNNNQKTTQNIKENQKIILNKLIPQKESVYSINQPNKKILKNNDYNNQSIKKQIDDSSFYSQKPVQTFELNLNINNNINKKNNIVNIDNQSSAFELFFIAKKKIKNNYKITTLYQIGPEQKPLSLTFLSIKENKIKENIINEINIPNNSFVSKIENNSFAENEINYLNNNNNKKNELKIKQNPERKKPVLQIMTSGNKSNYNKKLSENNIPNVNGFSLEDNNNESLKNNFGCISKSASMIVNNNNIPDISFISNTKETENFLEMNDKNNFGFLGIDNNNNNYIIVNKQLYFLSEKKNMNNINNISMNNSINKTNAKKYIKIEYYDTQPVYFDIISKINLEQNNNKINEIYKMYRVEEIQFIKENDDNNEDKSIEKEENKSLNTSNTKKKRKRRRKK